MQRRHVIKSAGALCALGGIGTVSGRPDDRPIPAENAGVEKAVKNHLKRGRHEKAKQLLDRHGVNYETRSEEVTVGDADDEVSTQGRYSETASEMYLTVVEWTEDDRWLATGSGILSDRVYRLSDAAIVDDGCGITVDTNEWTILGSDYVNTTAYSDGSFGADMELEDIDPNSGVAASVTLPPNLDDDTVISLQVEMEKTGSVDDAPVFFDYEHTRAYVDLPSQVEIFIETINNSGVLQVLVEDGGTAWEANLDATPGGEDGW